MMRNCPMSKNAIPAGTIFGHLTVLERLERVSGDNRYFRCRCACGAEVEVQGSHLLYSGITSCGCDRPPRPKTSSPSERRLRTAWRHMINRCTDPADKDYGNYGGRGISVCPEWVNDFGAFRDWSLENGYAEDLSLDRIDNDGGYAPINCHWATICEQNRNTSRVRRYTAWGETKILSVWAEDPRCQVSYFALRQRVVYLGWKLEAALLTGKHERPQSKAA